MSKTIRVADDTREALVAQMGAQETFDQVIARLLEEVRLARSSRRRGRRRAKKEEGHENP